MKPEVKQAIAVIDRNIERQWGNRCDTFEATCVVCQAWRARDDLFNFLEDFDVEHGRKNDG